MHFNGIVFSNKNKLNSSVPSWQSTHTTRIGRYRTTRVHLASMVLGFVSLGHVVVETKSNGTNKTSSSGDENDF